MSTPIREAEKAFCRSMQWGDETFIGTGANANGYRSAIAAAIAAYERAKAEQPRQSTLERAAVLHGWAALPDPVSVFPDQWQRIVDTADALERERRGGGGAGGSGQNCRSMRRRTNRRVDRNPHPRPQPAREQYMTEKRTCGDCKFAILSANGYSNWTVEGTDFDCARGAHPEGNFDWFYGENPHIRFAERCQSFETGDPISIDCEYGADGEPLYGERPLPPDKRAIYDAWAGRQEGST